MRYKLTTLLGAILLMLLFNATGSAQTKAENNILIPLHVGAKGWMQALVDQGYNPAQVCKLRYADGRLVNGSEAWHSPETVYITFSKDTKVSRTELTRFLRDAAGPRFIPIVGKPVLSEKLAGADTRGLPPVKAPAKTETPITLPAQPVVPQQSTVTSQTSSDPTNNGVPDMTRLQKTKRFVNENPIEVYSSVLAAGVILLMVCSFIIYRHHNPKKDGSQRWERPEVAASEAVSNSKADTVAEPVSEPIVSSEALPPEQSVEDIAAEIHMDQLILGNQQPLEATIN